MEEYAVTYEKIALNGYQIEHILSLEMQENVNDHGKLHLTAVISEELAEQYVYTKPFAAYKFVNTYAEFL